MKSYEATPPRKVAFLGLGVMGHPMAGHLTRAGHAVTVYNRTAAKAEAWVKEHGGRSAATPRQAVADADLVFACVGNDDDLRAIVLGDDGAFANNQAFLGDNLAVDLTVDSCRPLEQQLAANLGAAIEIGAAIGT